MCGLGLFSWHYFVTHFLPKKSWVLNSPNHIFLQICIPEHGMGLVVILNIFNLVTRYISTQEFNMTKRVLFIVWSQSKEELVYTPNMQETSISCYVFTVS